MNKPSRTYSNFKVILGVGVRRMRRNTTRQNAVGQDDTFTIEYWNPGFVTTCNHVK